MCHIFPLILHFTMDQLSPIFSPTLKKLFKSHLGTLTLVLSDNIRRGAKLYLKNKLTPTKEILDFRENASKFNVVIYFTVPGNKLYEVVESVPYSS